MLPPHLTSRTTVYLLDPDLLDSTGAHYEVDWIVADHNGYFPRTSNWYSQLASKLRNTGWSQVEEIDDYTIFTRLNR